MIRPVVLAGGAGARLWPLSRQNYPKQFMPLIGERSLFQESLLRVRGVDGLADPIVICNEVHRFLAAGQARELGAEPETVIVEPVVRNTAPALTLAALRLSGPGGRSAGDPIMLVMPADHLVTDVPAFRRAMSAAAELATAGQIVTFGVIPASPETGYGYIRTGENGGSDSAAADGATGRRVVEFVEKPDAETALHYLDTGEYLWNSGIFMMRSGVWLSELERFRPDILEACRVATSTGTVDGAFFRPGPEFSECPAESIDYAVMEKGPEHARSAAGGSGPGCVNYSVVSLDAGWSDVGAWSAVWDAGERDEHGNVVQGDVYAVSTRDSLLLSRQRLLVAVGLEDVVVVETADALLVAHKDRVQEVKGVVDRLRADGRSEHENHRKVNRPWGSYEVVDKGDGFQVKRLIVDPGAALSLQKHHHRAEHWVVVKGTARVTVDDAQYILSENQSTYVPQGSTHRLENSGGVPLEIVEVQTGDYLGEDDIVRLQDDYGRHEHD